MKGRFVFYGVALPALVVAYVGCGSSDETPAGSSTRKGSTTKTSKGGSAGKGGSSATKGGSGGGDLPGGSGGSGELEIDEQEPDTCSHDACDPGLPLPEQCSPCVGTICKTQPSCCNDHWDDTCTHLARGIATCACDAGGIGTGTGGSSSTGGGGSSTTGTGGSATSGKGGSSSTGSGGADTSSKGGSSTTGAGGTASTGGSSGTPTPSCSHTPCEAGGPLKTTCSLCAAQVCAQQATCCQTDWSDECLQVAATVTGCSCAPGTGTGGSSSGTGGTSTGTGGTSSGKGGSSGSGGTSTGTGGTSSGKGGSSGSGGTSSGKGGSSGTGGTSTGSSGNGSGTAGTSGTGKGGSSTGGAGSDGGGDAGNGGQAGWMEGGAGGADGGCHSPCEEGDALAKSCGLVPFGICLYDPFCCDKANGSWNASCVGYATKLFLCKKEDDRANEAACDHDVCEAGKPLRADCDDCTAKVCAKDSYCCDTSWDGLCLGKASELCQKCNDNAGMCDHAACAVGGPLKSDCEPCVAEVCKTDDYCCKTNWDALCVNTAADACECGKTCDHEPCVAGGPLKKSCSETTKAVCADDPYCCGTFWDILCVDLAAEKGGCGDKCGHDVCKTGTALQADCGDCEKKICDKDPTCCDFTHGWDIVCTSEVAETCGKQCP